MRILEIEVIGLLGRESAIQAQLHSDINILTGRNGSGKTSVLKLIWYIVSGNLLEALREVPFTKARVKTTEYDCLVHRLGSQTCRIELTIEDVTYLFEDDVDDDVIVLNAEDQANERLRETGGSVFFPTFRRIEGGFTLDGPRPRAVTGINRIARPRSDIEESLRALSQRLSWQNHIFVASISTADIVTLLLSQYSDLSAVYAEIQKRVQQEIVQTIMDLKSVDTESQQLDAANKVLDGIRAKIERMEADRNRVMSPFEVVREMVAKLFTHTGIKIGNRLSFGDTANAINSDLLSAGEKQMLSFICYNAFYKNSIFFIDEPELSLHVDWQRQLFTLLQKQQSTNQFIIATHSPFIYSKYPSNEILIDSDRGDTERGDGQ